MVGAGLEFEGWVEWFSDAADAQIKCPGSTTSNDSICLLLRGGKYQRHK